MPNVAGYESALTKHSPNGQCPGFVIGARLKDRRPRAGVGSWGGGSNPLPHQLGA